MDVYEIFTYFGTDGKVLLQGIHMWNMVKPILAKGGRDILEYVFPLFYLLFYYRLNQPFDT